MFKFLLNLFQVRFLNDVPMVEVPVVKKESPVLRALRRGRRRIERGWCQKVFMQPHLFSPNQYCALGAIHSSKDAQRALGDALPSKNRPYGVCCYNDNRGRTQADILALYDRAIQAEQGKVA